MPGRKPGPDYGQKRHRSAPPPAHIDEVHEAPLPDACPECGGPIAETDVQQQYQVEIPRQPIRPQFNIHVGHCCCCARRVQGRLLLQTSDALGAAAAQLGPDAQAAVVDLNKQAGLSHGKVNRYFWCNRRKPVHIPSPFPAPVPNRLPAPHANGARQVLNNDEQC
jgi:transposase